MLIDEDGRISALTPGDAPESLKATTIYDASGQFVAPGFRSAHSHLWTSGMRGLGFDSSLYGWASALVDIYYEGTAEDYYWFTLGGARVLRVDDKIGSLTVGKYGDFLIVDPSAPDSGPIYDAYASYVLAMGLRNLKRSCRIAMKPHYAFLEKQIQGDRTSRVERSSLRGDHR